MNKFIKSLGIAAVFSAPSFAAEAFGGVGISFYTVRDGARVVEVIPGTPAAQTKLQKGDLIVAVDGVSLKGVDSETAKSKLRGEKNQPVQLTFVSGTDTLETVLRRTQIAMKDVYNTAVAKQEGDNELVAILEDGRLVKGERYSEKTQLNGVYVEKLQQKPVEQGKKVAKASTVEVRGLSRNAVSFELTENGSVQVSIVNADGATVANIRFENAKAGFNSVAWNSENVPSGRYMVSVEHNGAVSGKYAVLK